MDNSRLIKVSDELVINPAHVAFAEWEGAELTLHFVTAEARTSHRDGVLADHTKRILEGDEAKRCWAALTAEGKVN